MNRRLLVFALLLITASSTAQAGIAICWESKSGAQRCLLENSQGWWNMFLGFVAW